MREPSVLFVCMGNICRSPTAEALMKRTVAEAGLDDRVEVDSAGTIAYHAGEPPDRRMREAAHSRGVVLEGKARKVTPEDLERFTLVIAMDRENLRDLQALGGSERGNLRLFSHYLPGGEPVDVPDPYYGGPAGFARVLDVVEDGCSAILEELVAS